MPALARISESMVSSNIQRAIADVFKTMLGRSIVGVASGPNSLPLAGKVVVGQVGFVGDFNGFTYLYFDEDFAKECVSSMLGMDAREIDGLGNDAVKDAIGELTNMTVGSFKNGLCDAGFTCKLTIPSLVSARDFVVMAPPRWATRYVYLFNSNGHRVVAEVLLKSE